LQAELLESIPPEKAANIVDEMPPDEAADVLNELPPETSAELLADMEKEGAEEVRELLAFEENTAGSMMTTEYVVVNDSATVEGAIEAIRNFEGQVEAIHQVFTIDGETKLTGAVPLGKIVLAAAASPLKDLASELLVSVQAEQSARAVVDLFHKYNLMSLPVVDEQRYLLGVVTADDVLEHVINRK
jgi:Mg/Co/Ni transporter MgtE